MEPPQLTELIARINPDMLDVEEIEQVEDDAWEIRLANGVIIRVDWIPDPSRLFFTTLIGRPSVDHRYLVYEAMLTFNALWKSNDCARIAVNGEDGDAMFIYELHVKDDLTVDTLDILLARYVELADLWCQYVSSEAESAKTTPFTSPLIMTLLA